MTHYPPSGGKVSVRKSMANTGVVLQVWGPEDTPDFSQAVILTPSVAQQVADAIVRAARSVSGQRVLAKERGLDRIEKGDV